MVEDTVGEGMITTCNKCGGLKSDCEMFGGQACFCAQQPLSGPSVDTLPPLHRAMPHVCPVCHGGTRVPKGFYSGGMVGGSTSLAETEQCRACNNGVILA